MSQEPTVITLPGGSARDFLVDGQPFSADFDDAELLHGLLSLSERITEAAGAHKPGDDPAPVLAALLALSDDAEAMIDQAFGTGAHAKLFGGRAKPFMRSLALVTELAKAAGPVYDTMFAEYQPPASEPSAEI